MARPIIVGMNNPKTSDPRFALYPHPPGSAGGRLFAMLKECRPEVKRIQYRDAFVRVNLVSGRWSLPRARIVGSVCRLLLTGTDRDVLVLGNGPWDALGLPPSQGPLWKYEQDEVRWRLIPHPSGRNRWYNDEANRRLVGMILEELMPRE